MSVIAFFPRKVWKTIFSACFATKDHLTTEKFRFIGFNISSSELVHLGCFSVPAEAIDIIFQLGLLSRAAIIREEDWK